MIVLKNKQNESMRNWLLLIDTFSHEKEGASASGNSEECCIIILANGMLTLYIRCSIFLPIIFA